MWVRIAQFRLDPCLAEEAIRRYEEQGTARVRAFEGSLGCYLLRPVAPADLHLAITFWQTEAHATAYETSGAAQEVAGLIRGAFVGPPQLRSYQSTGAAK